MAGMNELRDTEVSFNAKCDFAFQFPVKSEVLTDEEIVARERAITELKERVRPLRELVTQADSIAKELRDDIHKTMKRRRQGAPADETLPLFGQ